MSGNIRLAGPSVVASLDDVEAEAVEVGLVPALLGRFGMSVSRKDA